MPEPSEGRPRGTFLLLRDSRFGPFFFGKLVSTMGLWIHNITSALLVYELTGSALLVGSVTFAQFAPQLFLTPWSGARADRADRRRQLIAGRLLTAAGSGGLMVWLLVIETSGTETVVALLVSSFTIGLGVSLGGPAMEALLPSLVKPSEWPAAISLNALPLILARAAGPALGALIATLSGPAIAFGLSGLTHLVFAAVIRILVHEPPRPVVQDVTITAGLRYVLAHRDLSLLLIGVAAVGFGADPVVTLTPSIADELGTGPQFVGVLASAFGMGSTVAFGVFGWCRRRMSLHTLSTGGLLAIAFGLATLAFSDSTQPALLALVVAGSGMTFSLTSLTTLIQQRSPDELRGRIMALWAVAFLGSRPVAAPLYGGLADLISTSFALLVAAGLVMGGAYAACRTRSQPAPTCAQPGPVLHKSGQLPRVPRPPSSVPPQQASDV